MIGELAVVTKVLPERYGVLVRFSNGVQTYDNGENNSLFVRVLCRRAHASGGAEVDLPQVGELGIVADLEDGHQVWLGSIHWQDTNWVDPTPDVKIDRHTSGVRTQIRRNGNMQLDHPSGLRITVAEEQGALSDLQRIGDAAIPPVGPCDMELEHPSGLDVHVDSDGALTMVFPSGGSISVDTDGKLEMKGFSQVNLQDANARFCMEDLYTWVKTHKHTGVQSGSSVTGAPQSAPPDSSLSPSTLKGPHA